MSAVPYEQRQTGRLGRSLSRFGPTLLILALVIWHGAHNWLWLSSNTVLTGWDKARHLAQSLTYNNLLTPLTLRSFFGAFISDSVRPPFAPMLVVPLYRLFGTSSDVAAMLNTLYIAVVLVATYRIGMLLPRQKREPAMSSSELAGHEGKRLGALSVLLLALFPMFYAMSRYFYLEFPLMALVALSIWMLLASAGFENRGRSLLFGLCLGLGLLTKRTYVAFLFAPVGLVLLTSDAMPALWRRLRGRIRLDLKHTALALGGGLALAAIWLGPSWSTVRDLALGGWIFPIWAGLVATTIYLLLRRPGPDVNFLAAVSLGTVVGSTWYLANVGFAQRMLLFGYGVNDPRGRIIRLGSFYTYVEYLATLINQHISLMVAILLVGAGLTLAFALVRRRKLFVALRRVGVNWWAVLLWVVGPYLVLTLSIYHEARAITPVLPAIALIGAGLILKIPWRVVRAGLLILPVVFGIVQFYAVSFEPLHWLVGATSLRLPLLGETSLLGRGGYLQLPDAEATDSGYWIEPDVLKRMEEKRLAEGWDTASLGLLINHKQINFEHFAYLTLAGGYYPGLTVERLARAHGPEPVYPRLFKHDYLLVKRENDAVDADSQAVIGQILDEPPQLFSQAFELDKSYPIPDGDTVYLYRRRERPPGGATASFFPELSQALNRMANLGGASGRTQAVVVIPPDLVPLLGQGLEEEVDVYALPTDEPTGAIMPQVAAGHDVVFAVFGEGDGDDLDRAGRQWLNEHGYRAWDNWYGPTQLVVYGISPEPERINLQSVDHEFGEEVTLRSYALWEGQREASGLLYLTFVWQARKPIDDGYKVFVHLVDGNGQLVAQRDGEPLGGSRPTTSWEVGEEITDRVGLLLPPDLPPGEYDLLVGMYDPETLDRLPVRDDSGNAVGDSVALGSIQLSDN
jgi:4-amino-4-deoxy-L-arabinose transferase-like glycosyltransferase